MKRIIISESQLNMLLKEGNYGYHYGDLGKGHSDGLVRKPIDGHYDIGYGTYFFGEKGNRLFGMGYRDRPMHKIDINQYYLFRPKNEADGIMLNKFFGELNDYYVRIPKQTPSTIEEFQNILTELRMLYKVALYNPEAVDESVVNTFIKKAERLFPLRYASYRVRALFPVDKNEYDDYAELIRSIYYVISDNSASMNGYCNCYHDVLNKEKIDNDEFGICNIVGIDINTYRELLEQCKEYFNKEYTEDNINAIRSNPYLEDKDTIGTFFMKQLGYNGIDLREFDSLDNSAYGSVIYDMNKKKE